jgi:hypothetical protein
VLLLLVVLLLVVVLLLLVVLPLLVVLSLAKGTALDATATDLSQMKLRIAQATMAYCSYRYC